jgi:hypothetical protein
MHSVLQHGDGFAHDIGSLGEAEYSFPTTVSQQALWYLDQVEPGNPAWNIAVRFQIEGPLQVEVLEWALNRLVEQHEILRTTFSLTEEHPEQMVHAAATIPLPLHDLSLLPPAERDREQEQLTTAEGTRNFDLESGPLFRARLLCLAPQTHILLVTVHHIVSDGWSIGIISDEIGRHYQALLDGTASNPSPAALQFGDFAVWQTTRSGELPLTQHGEYWKRKLSNLPRCEIPPDHPRPPHKTHNGFILSTVLPRSLTDQLARYSSAQNCTLFVTSLAALTMLIQRYARQDDIYVGTLLAGRQRLDLEGLIGLFINTIVLRTDLSADPTFPELLGRVRETVEEGLAHQDLPFPKLVELLRPKRDPSRPTLYGINFIFQRDFVKPARFGGVSMVPLPSRSPGAIYDLNFFMVERGDGWRLSCEYNCDLYEAASVNRMLGELESLLQQIAVNPEQRLSHFRFKSDGDRLAAEHSRPMLARTERPESPISTAQPNGAGSNSKNGSWFARFRGIG